MKLNKTHIWRRPNDNFRLKLHLFQILCSEIRIRLLDFTGESVYLADGGTNVEADVPPVLPGDRTCIG